MEIVRLLIASESTTEQILKLLRQLSPDGSDLITSREELHQILQDKSFWMLVAYDEDNDNILGMASFFVKRVLSKYVAQIHDVLVDERSRGQGISKQLCFEQLRQLRNIAKEVGSNIELSLTSRPSRVVANKLYQSLGFTLVAEATGKRGTNYYRMIITPD